MIDLGGGMLFPDSWACDPPDPPEPPEPDETEQYLEFVGTIAADPAEGGTL